MPTRKLEPVLPRIEFRELCTDGNDQIGFRHDLLYCTLSRNAPCSQRMIVSKVALTAGCGEYVRQQSIGKFAHRSVVILKPGTQNERRLPTLANELQRGLDVLMRKQSCRLVSGCNASC